MYLLADQLLYVPTLDSVNLMVVNTIVKKN